MTNISNLNLTKGTIPPLLKYKIVFLGDQAVGKSSIINRFIYDIFDGNEHVRTPSCRDPPSASISSPRISSSRRRPSDCSFGIPPARNVSGPSSPTTSVTLPSQLLSMMSPTAFPSTVSKSGSTMSRTSEGREL